MSEQVFVQGPNGLVIGYPKSVADGLVRHPDHKKVAAPVRVELKPGEYVLTAADVAAAALAAAGVPDDELAAAQAAALAIATAGEDKAPAGNASKDDWYAYALANGKTSADLDGLGQREIRALFTE